MTGPDDTLPLALGVFDSGLGGLSVARAIRAHPVGGRMVYLADHAGFPYGARADEDVVARTIAGVSRLFDRADPSAIVIACNTASTLALGAVRAAFAHRLPPERFVGAVPAIKPAAKATRSGLISVLATPRTVTRDYTRALITEFAKGAEVTLVGAPRLAALAEALTAGAPGDDPEITQQIEEDIAAAFVETAAGARTDVIVLACTHYPLIADTLARLAPWPVTWIDPAPAIARRVAQVAPELAGAPAAQGLFLSTQPQPLAPGLSAALADLSLHVEEDAVTLALA